MKNNVKCRKCGGRLVYEEFFQRGRIYTVFPNGKIGSKFKYRDYGGDDEIMVYCASCGTAYEFSLVECGQKVVLKGELR